MELHNSPFVVFFICAIVAAFGYMLMMETGVARRLAPFGLGAIVLPIVITLRENKK